jgi:hypothetical protein
MIWRDDHLDVAPAVSLAAPYLGSLPQIFANSRYLDHNLALSSPN